MKELKKLGWIAYECPHQADTHIASVCSDNSADDPVTVVTGDSDLIAYRGIWNVVMPVGRSHELTNFSKSDLLTSLNLPSEQHLLLAAIVTKNDYFGGVKWYGIKRNTDVIRDMELAPGLDVESVTGSVRRYLDLIKRRDTKISDFRHAITAFVACHEDSTEDAFPSVDSHNEVATLLTKLETNRLDGRRTRRKDRSLEEHLTTPDRAQNQQRTTKNRVGGRHNNGRQMKRNKQRAKEQSKKRRRRRRKQKRTRQLYELSK